MDCPKRLYKFRSPTIQDITSLSGGKIWFSSPARFNDPFDCAYDARLSKLSRDECVSILEKATAGKLNAAKLAAYTDEKLKEEVRSGLEIVITDALKKVGGVCCFSATLTDLLLWGHYAEGHRGFCLEFDTTADPIFQKANPVRYSDALPALTADTFLNGDFRQILDLVLTKAECWKYEQEWRVLHQDAGVLFGYQRASLVGVYFGAKMTDDQILMICSLLQKTDVKTYRMQLSKSRFELQPEPITFTPIDYRTTAGR